MKLLSASISTSMFAIFIVLFLTQSAQSLRMNHKYLYPWYEFDQGPGGNRCKIDLQCDGERTCNRAGWCQGTARRSKDEYFQYDQDITGGMCNEDSKYKDYFCDGNRTCNEQGQCQGEAR